MLDIAICDDDIKTGILLEMQLENYYKERGVAYHIDVFVRPEELLEEMSGKQYELLFLDIELPEGSGIAVGEYIREEVKDYMIEIVYISYHTQYAMELFKVQPLDFLVKPLTDKDIKRVLQCFQKRRRVRNECFAFKTGKTEESVLVNQILYLESDKKKVRIHLLETYKEYYGKLADAEKILEKFGFWHIHKSFLVNCKYIKMYENDRVILVNGMELGISKTHRSEVRRKLMEMRRREM